VDPVALLTLATALIDGFLFNGRKPSTHTA
jgi:hypothetical protein